MIRTSLLAILVAGSVLAGCGAKRRFGDAGGTPVAVHVVLDRAFVSGMRNRQGRVGVGVGAGFSSGGGSSLGTGVGLSFSATTVALVGGDGPGQAQVFRKTIEWGETDFTVPLTPGRTLHLAIQVEGGRQGWEALGSVEIPRAPQPRVDVLLGAAGPKLSVSPAPTTVSTSTTIAPSPASAPAAAEPAPQPAPTPSTPTP